MAVGDQPLVLSGKSDYRIWLVPGISPRRRYTRSLRCLLFVNPESTALECCNHALVKVVPSPIPTLSSASMPVHMRRTSTRSRHQTRLVLFYATALLSVRRT